MNSMIFTDQPIKEDSEDLLNRSEFTKQLKSLINSYKDSECIVLALMGEWGSGKTSLINLTLNSIEKEYVIFKFDPWLFSEQKNLVFHFFNELFLKLKSNKKVKNLKVADDLKKYFSKLLKSCKWSASLDLRVLNVNVERPPTDKLGDESLMYSKIKINECLSKLEELKVIIIIDNIDRLNDLEIKQIFQLVKSLADFKNIIYILSFDKDRVIKALEPHVQNAEEYLEKIIQIPIRVPKIENKQLRRYVENKLRILLDKKEIVLNNKDFIIIYKYLNLFIRNIRDAKRYYNELNFYLNFLKSEINIKDYLLILALQIFEQSIYDDIRSNKKLFTDVNIKEEDKQNIEVIIQKGKKLDKENIIDILKELFPKISILYSADRTWHDPTIYTPSNLEKWEDELKIASPNIFDRYFTLTIPENEISEIEFNNILHSSSYESLEQKILELNKQEKSKEWLRKLSDNSQKIPENQISLFIEFLFKKADILNISHKLVFYKENLIVITLGELIDRVDYNQRFNIIKENISKEDASLFMSIYFIMYNKEKTYLNEEQLKQINNVILDKIHLWKENKQLLSCYRLNIVLDYWSIIENKEVVEEFIKEVLKDENKTIKFINGFIKEESIFNIEKNSVEIISLFDFETMGKLISLEYVKEQLNEKQYPNKLIEEFKRQIEKETKNKLAST